MEKYGRWSDRRTGVNPFLPPKGEPESIVGTIFRYTIGIPVSLLRILLIAVVGLVYFAFFRLVRFGPRIPVVSRALERLFDIVFARFILFVLGFWWIDESAINTKKRSAPSPKPSIDHGDLVVSNRISYVEVVYLQYKLSPVFVTVPNRFEVVGGESERFREDQKFGGQGNVGSGMDGEVAVMDLFSLIFDTLSLTPRPPPDTKEHPKGWTKLSRVIEDAKSARTGPVVFFPEGTTSNGKAVLMGPSVLDTSAKMPLIQTNVHIIAFRASEQAIFIGYEKALVHTFLLCQRVSSQLEAIAITPSCVPAPPEQGAALSLWEAWEQDLTSLIAQPLRVPKVTLSATDKFDFVNFWRQNH